MSWFQSADIIVDDFFKEKFLSVVNIPLTKEDQYKNDSTFSSDLNTFLKSGKWPLRGRLLDKTIYHGNLQGQILDLVQNDNDLNSYLDAKYQKKSGGRRRHKSRRRKTQRRKTQRRRQ